MNRTVSILLLVIVFSCQIEENVPTLPTVDNFDEASATLLKQGTIIGIGHTASGIATIYDNNGQKFVVLDPYTSQNGPDLKVYLSKNINASSYINLGALKSITGKQTYTVRGNPDIDEYTYVHIWCERYSVEFGRAPLQ